LMWVSPKPWKKHHYFSDKFPTFPKIFFMLKKILLGIFVVLVLAQFIRPTRNISETPSPNHISKAYPVPADVEAIFNKACNDCHSNNTVYPWYASIQPVAGWLDHHIDEGKGELNFDEFITYKPKKAHHKLEEVNEMVKEGEMPLESYTWIHKDAKLTQEEKLIVANWTVATMDSIEKKFPEVLVPNKR